MPLLLIQASMNGHHLDTLEEEVLMNIVDIGFVLAEDQHRRWGLLQTFQQVHQLGLLLHIFDFLDNIQVRCTSTADVDDNGIDKGRLREVLDFPRHSRTEKQRLTLPPEVVQCVADLFLEAEVHHAIGLVHTEVPALRHGHALLGEQVIEPTGRRDDHVGSLPQLLGLGGGTEAADGKHCAQLREVAMVFYEFVGVELQHLIGLVGQLPGGRDDEAVGPLPALHLGPQLLL
mmetsp:Transcript_49533/g.105967  ORF Transcript_49533/g.105967 Transcript_49533/m.105967 type:complete len:231 (+) Transcript_49533:524-1216(+)